MKETFRQKIEQLHNDCLGRIQMLKQNKQEYLSEGHLAQAYEADIKIRQFEMFERRLNEALSY